MAWEPMPKHEAVRVFESGRNGTHSAAESRRFHEAILVLADLPVDVMRRLLEEFYGPLD